MTSFNMFSIRELKARAKWLERAAEARGGEVGKRLLKQRDEVLVEIAKREAA